MIHEDGMDLLGIRGSVPPRPWRVVPRLDFLFPPPRSIWPLVLSPVVALSLRPDEERDRRKGAATLVGQRQREESESSEPGQKKGTRLAFPAAALSGHTYSDCRFKCLLITKLVPQPPRSRSLCIFISTSYGRFRERERNVSYSSADAAADRLSSPLRDTRQDDSFWRVLSLYSRCMRSRLAGNRHNR